MACLLRQCAEQPEPVSDHDVTRRGCRTEIDTKRPRNSFSLASSSAMPASLILPGYPGHCGDRGFLPVTAIVSPAIAVSLQLTAHGRPHR